MPRYFFRIIDGETNPDLEGTEMPDLAAARRAAIDIAAEQLKGRGEWFWIDRSWRIEVADEVGAVLVAITVTGEVVAVPGTTAQVG